MTIRRLPFLSALALLASMPPPSHVCEEQVLQPAPRLPDPRELTAQDVERIEAAKAKRARRAERRRG